ncbi:hypothetical protein BDV39DRAFT_175373 [Aspergillus sergii]|uniref:Uncharacterized protein n=1 Tax=Aspergillus sergii TaxID=1034303 RepID=A0A5N6X340_9EURO|nr:hypothetical protein BDV39DRAFT_175373 [Aspergillus sergii]
MVEFDSDHSGWDGASFFPFLGEWLMLDWEEWCVSLANLLGGGVLFGPVAFPLGIGGWVMYQDWKGYSL